MSANILPVPAPPPPYLPTFIAKNSSSGRRRCASSASTYSEGAVAGAEAALDLILMRIETLCALDHADQLVSRLLRCIDAATGSLIAADPKKVH